MHVGMATGFANHSQVNDRQFVNEELDQLTLAEELGFDSVWITEHHFSDYSVSPNPLFYLANLAGRTKRIRLGTQVLVVPWHDPVRLAEEIALLDNLSGGRAIIGFGRGLARMEYEGLRVDQTKARALFDEIVPMVMNALETGFIEGGEHFKQPRREIRPRPLRGLKGRAFVASGTPESMASAARLGLGKLFLGQPMTRQTKSDQPFSNPATKAAGQAPAQETERDVWLETWNESHPGETPPAPFVSNLVFIDESPDRAMELAKVHAEKTFRAAVKNYEMMSNHHGSLKGYESYASLVMSPEQVEEAARNAAAGSVVGDAKTVLAKLDEIRQLRQPQGMFPHLYTGGMSHADAVGSMRYFAKTCLNEMKSWKGAPSTIDGPMAMAAE